MNVGYQGLIANLTEPIGQSMHNWWVILGGTYDSSGSRLLTITPQFCLGTGGIAETQLCNQFSHLHVGLEREGKKVSFKLSGDFSDSCLGWPLFLFLKRFICRSHNLTHYGVGMLTVLMSFKKWNQLESFKN